MHRTAAAVQYEALAFFSIHMKDRSQVSHFLAFAIYFHGWIKKDSAACL